MGEPAANRATAAAVALVGLLAVLWAAEVGAVGTNAAGHSPKIGYAFDGYPIYGPFTDGGVLPDDLDICNGRTHPSLGYIYHVTPTAPYVIGCYHGEVHCPTTNNVAGCGPFTGDAASTDAAEANDCAKLSGELITGQTPNEVPWTVDVGKVPTTAHCGKTYCPVEAAYSWDYAAATPLGLTSSVTCSVGTSVSVDIASNGVPDHDVAKFPMNHPGGTVGAGHGDNPNTIVEQSYSWRIPLYPKPVSPAPTVSVLSDGSVLPMGPIGFSLNGVPLFNPFNVHLDDAVDPASDGYEVMGPCVGHPTGSGQYHYHSIPWCTFVESAATWQDLARALSINEDTCMDGVQNNDETDVDCGGHCPARCGKGFKCAVDTDCDGGEVCSAGMCGRQPNIVFIMVDDWGWNDYGHRSTDLSFATAAMDRLSSEGIELTRSYVSPTCTPSRAALLSGRYAERLGLNSPVGHKNRHGLPLDEVTVAQELKNAGYNTAWIGKWHLGFWSPDALPWSRGFDRTYGFVGAGGEEYYSKMTPPNNADQYFDMWDDGVRVTNPTEIATYNTELFADKAAAFVQDSYDADPNKPFFLYYAMQNVHEPLEYPATYLDDTPCSSVTPAKRGQYCALLMAGDQGVKTVMDKIRALGIEDDTVVILTSDNGGAPTYGGFNNPLRGSKGTVWEGGVRAPGAVWAPSRLPASRVGATYDGLVHVSDWFPTILRLANRERSGGCAAAKPLDSYNVWDAIVAGRVSPRSEVVHSFDPEDGGKRALRVGHFKLVTNAADNTADQWREPGGAATPGSGATGLTYLFNITADPTEATNLWDNPTYADVQVQLVQRMQEVEANVVMPACDIVLCNDAAAETAAIAEGAWVPWVAASFDSNTECSGLASFEPVRWYDIAGCPDPNCGTCATGTKDGDETDVDCGGSCDVCEAGKSCLANGDCASNQCESGVCKSNAHSPKLGYAFDGFPIYGPFTDGGVLPDDLDICNGRTHPSLGYIYHTSPTPPYGPGCYSGEVICTTVKSIPGCVTASQLTGSGAGDTHDCASLNAELRSGASPNQVPWTVDAGKVPTRAHCGMEYCPAAAAYSWAYDTTTTLGLTSSVACSDPTQSQAVQVDSNGIPDHDVGQFPLDHAGSTTGRAGVDNPNTIAAQSYSWKLPRYPKLKATAPSANIVSDSNALPTGPIGFALNGVPFENPYDGGVDTVDPTSDGYRVMDACYGAVSALGQYAYRGTPWSTFTVDASEAAVRAALGIPSGQCTDTVLNGDETDTDCGGLCDPCAAGELCADDGDCNESSCDVGGSGTCVTTCSDGWANGEEGGVDCGGSCPAPCTAVCSADRIVPNLFKYDDGTGSPLAATDDCGATGYTCDASTPTLEAGGTVYYLVEAWADAAARLTLQDTACSTA